jgi:hypothetical protein
LEKKKIAAEESGSSLAGFRGIKVVAAIAFGAN